MTGSGMRPSIKSPMHKYKCTHVPHTRRFKSVWESSYADQLLIAKDVIGGLLKLFRLRYVSKRTGVEWLNLEYFNLSREA